MIGKTSRIDHYTPNSILMVKGSKRTSYIESNTTKKTSRNGHKGLPKTKNHAKTHNNQELLKFHSRQK